MVCIKTKISSACLAKSLTANCLSTSATFLLFNTPNPANIKPFNNASVVVAPSINFEVTKPYVPSANALAPLFAILPVRPNPAPNIAFSVIVNALSAIGESSSI